MNNDNLFGNIFGHTIPNESYQITLSDEWLTYPYPNKCACACACRFIGPTGVQMVVNCLPLYMLPDDAAQAALSNNNSEESSEDQNDTDCQNRGRKKSKNSPKKPQHLRKAKSLTSIAIAEIELSDEEKQSRSDNELLEDTPQTKKRKKSRLNSFGAHYSVKVHRQLEPIQATIEETDAAPPIRRTDKKAGSPVKDLGQSCDVEKPIQSTNPTINNERAEADDKEASSTDTNPSPQEPDEIVQKKVSKSPVTKSKSVGSASELDISDPEDSKQGFEVNYLDTTSTLPRLKRSSGSVSFPHRISIVPVPATNSVIAEESSLTSQRSDDPQPTSPTVPDSSQEEPKNSEKIETESLTNNDTQEVTDGSLDKTEGTEAPEGEQQPTASKPENKESTESEVPEPADVIVEQAKPIENQDTTTDISPTSSDVLPAASVQKSSTPPRTQEPSPTDPLASKELATAPNPPSTPSQSTPPPLTFTPLPSSPVTMNGDYVERSGWLTKLSHRKGMFGDKWQKRYFVLHRSWLYYFKKYGVSLILLCVYV